MDAVTEYAQQEEWDAWVHRYTWHLDRLPPLLQQMRDQVTPLGATRLDIPRVSGGGMKDTLPMRVDAADDAQELWGLLYDYAHAVMARIGEQPATVFFRFVAVDPNQAWRTSYELVAWLLDDDRLARIVEHHDLAELEEQLFREVRKGGTRYGLAPSRHDRKRVCTLCGERAVVATWVDEGAGTVGIARCGRCGNTERGTAA